LSHYINISFTHSARISQLSETSSTNTEARSESRREKDLCEGRDEGEGSIYTIARIPNASVQVITAVCKQPAETVMQSAVIQSRMYHSGNFGASAGWEMKQEGWELK